MLKISISGEVTYRFVPLWLHLKKLSSPLLLEYNRKLFGEGAELAFPFENVAWIDKR